MAGKIFTPDEDPAAWHSVGKKPLSRELAYEEAAHEYLASQSHNLSDPYVYVHYAGYANYQMDNLFNEKAEKND